MKKQFFLLQNFRKIAKDKEELKKIGITHVVNCAKGSRPGQIDTDASFFKDVEIQFLGLQAKDILNYDISKHFEKAANFIDQALSKGGKKLSINRNMCLHFENYLVIKSFVCVLLS